MTTGAIQRLATQSADLSTAQVIVAGSGSLVFRCAAILVRAGIRVQAVIEAATRQKALKQVGGALLKSQYVRQQAYQAMKTLLKAGVPVYYGHAVKEARGVSDLEQIVYFPLGQPDSSVKTIKANTLCVSHGLEPNTRICRLMGCKMRLDQEMGVFFPDHDANMQTSLSNVFVAGEVAGFGGVRKALLDGEIAGLQVAAALGYTTVSTVSDRLESLHLEQKKVIGEARANIGPFMPAAQIQSFTTPDTLVCRCEEVSLQAIRQALQVGDGSIRDLKLRTRVGMGICQGRNCETAIRHELDASAAIDEAFSIRPPLEPLPLNELANLELK
jgi:NAD(P)H-nitrite reductase large subunit